MCSTLLIPLDARPVCYQLPKQLASIAKWPLLLPEKSLLGLLKHPGDRDGLIHWWQEHPDAEGIVALDSVLYGGLIAGRVEHASVSELTGRLERFLEKSPRAILAFSSILRIPSYNNQEEEPAYWETYGEALYQLSVKSHQDDVPFDDIPSAVPFEIRQDMLNRRKRHFQINLLLLDALEQNKFAYLLYAQDDTGPYGLNVQEASALEKRIQEKALTRAADIQTGADEVAALMLARIISQQPRVYIKIFPESARDTLALFDGISIGAILEKQCKSLNARVVLNEADADFILAVYAPEDRMGDYCATPFYPTNPHTLNQFLDYLANVPVHIPLAIADVANANGASDFLMKELLARTLLKRLSGFAAWNTPGNSIGCALATGAIVSWAQKQQLEDIYATQITLATRLLEDWAYQGNVRQQLRKEYGTTLPLESILTTQLTAYWQKIRLQLPALSQEEPLFSFPCRRTFEIAVKWSNDCD
jgi:hypothetical protein